MNDTQNTLARFPGASIEHLLIPGTKTTRCGKDATTANRYPVLTRANSADRRPFPRCQACRTATGSVITVETTADELRVGDVIVTRFRGVRNTVTSAPRALGGSGLVAFGLHRPGRTVPVFSREEAATEELAESWDGRLHADSKLTVERRVAFSGPNGTPTLAEGQASSSEAQEPTTEGRPAVLSAEESEARTEDRIEELLAGDPWRPADHPLYQRQLAARCPVCGSTRRRWMTEDYDQGTGSWVRELGWFCTSCGETVSDTDAAE